LFVGRSGIYEVTNEVSTTLASRAFVEDGSGEISDTADTFANVVAFERRTVHTVFTAVECRIRFHRMHPKNNPVSAVLGSRDKRLRRFLGAALVLVVGAVLGMSGCGGADSSTPGGNTQSGGQDKPIVIAMLPKLINIAYFDACHRGAEQAAAELGVTLIYDGPTEPSGSLQNNFIDTWIRQGVDAICIAPNQPKAVRRFVEKAQARGIKVVTWDSDAPDSGRSVMVNQIDDQVLGEMLMDDIARQMNEQGEWAIAIASLDAANLNNWKRIAMARAEAKYPQMKLVDTIVTNEDENVARQKIETLLNARPNLKGIIAFDSNSVPGAAEALKRTGKSGQVALTGNSSPGKMKPYIKEGVLESFYLWDPRALGGLTVRVAHALIEGQAIQPGTELPGFGPLTFSATDPTMVILSDPIRFTKDNIDDYDFGI
jgi:rhamnose transport system substrate-binding protein